MLAGDTDCSEEQVMTATYSRLTKILWLIDSAQDIVV